MAVVIFLILAAIFGYRFIVFVFGLLARMALDFVTLCGVGIFIMLAYLIASLVQHA